MKCDTTDTHRHARARYVSRSNAPKGIPPSRGDNFMSGDRVMNSTDGTCRMRVGDTIGQIPTFKAQATARSDSVVRIDLRHKACCQPLTTPRIDDL